MQTLTVEVTNESNIKFLMELLQKFDFVSEVKVLTKPEKFVSNLRKTKQGSYEKHLIELKEKYKDLPIIWGKGEPEISDFAGIWKDRNITIEMLREKAWKRT